MDVLLDPRRRLAVLAEGSGGGLLTRLKSVDATFEAVPRGGFVARSSGGCASTCWRRRRCVACCLGDRLRGRAGDLRPVVPEGITWLRDVPGPSAWIISQSGRAVQVRVADAWAFALHKLWLSERPDRDPAKKGKDRLQAVVVAWLAARKVGLETSVGEMLDLQAIPAPLRERLAGLVEEGEAARVEQPVRRARVRAR